MAKANCLHFVGFRDDRYHNAVAVFGLPDFIHRLWDHRALADIAPGDVVVFARAKDAANEATPSPFSFNDSEVF